MHHSKSAEKQRKQDEMDTCLDKSKLEKFIEEEKEKVQ